MANQLYFSELILLELDTKIIKFNPEQAETYIRKGLIWSSLTLETLDQNFQFKGIFNVQAEEFKNQT